MNDNTVLDSTQTPRTFGKLAVYRTSDGLSLQCWEDPDGKVADQWWGTRPSTPFPAGPNGEMMAVEFGFPISGAASKEEAAEKFQQEFDSHLAAETRKRISELRQKRFLGGVTQGVGPSPADIKNAVQRAH